MKKHSIRRTFVLTFVAAFLLMAAAYAGDDIVVVGGLNADDPLATPEGAAYAGTFMLKAEVGMDPNDEQAYAFKLRKNDSILETKRMVDLSPYRTLEGNDLSPVWCVTVGEIRDDSPGPEILIGNDFGGVMTFDFHLTEMIDGWIDDGHPAMDVIVTNNYASEPGNEVMRITDRAFVGGTTWINVLNPSYGQFLWKIVSTNSIGNRFTEAKIGDIDTVIAGMELVTVGVSGWVNVWSSFYNYGFPVMRGIHTGTMFLGCDVGELDSNYSGLEIVAAENWYEPNIDDPNSVLSAVTLFGRNASDPYSANGGLLILRNYRDIYGWTTDVNLAELDSNNPGLEIVAVTSARPIDPWEGEVLLLDADPNTTDPNHIDVLATTNLTMPGVIPAGLLSVAVGEIDETSPGLEIIAGSQEGHVLVFNSDLTELLAETQLFDTKGHPIPIRDIATIMATPDGDLNLDGIVDGNDLSEFANDWLDSPYTVSASTPASSPLGWWKFDGDANDSSGNGYNGVADGDTNDVNFITDPCRAEVLALDVNGWISIPNEAPFDITGSITVSAWVNTDSSTSANIVSKDESWTLHMRSDGKASFVGSGIGFFWYGTNPQYVASTTDINDGLWHHIAGVYDASQAEIYIYVDGILEAVSPTDASKDLTTNDNSIEIGNSWTGFIDDVRVYSTALSQEEIAYLAEKNDVMQAAIPPLPSDKLLHGDNEVNFKDFSVLADEWLNVADWY